MADLTELDYPDLAYAIDKGGDDLDGPVTLNNEPTGDAMRSSSRQVPFSRVLRDGGSPAPGHHEQWERAIDALEAEGPWTVIEGDAMSRTPQEDR